MGTHLTLVATCLFLSTTTASHVPTAAESLDKYPQALDSPSAKR